MSQVDFAHQSAFADDEPFAHSLDQNDILRRYREEFLLPQDATGKPVIYFCSHSLGLQPKATAILMQEELATWAQRGVGGHFHGQTPWYHYQELFREQVARLVGAHPAEVILMNGLTVNLHLLMVSFYKPESVRYKILMEEPTFPSDLYAVKSQIQYHGLDPHNALVLLKPRPGEHVLRHEDIEAELDRRGQEIALVLLGGINFFTGQCLDVQRVARAARRQGCIVGFDLAHAVGNVLLRLHDWDVDFAVWCTYKYLCGGPGAVAGAFVHERHGDSPQLPRLAGWWGNNPATRFRMQLQPEFVPHTGANGWQVSNPPILALVPLRAALKLFDEIGMPALRAKSECLTAYLEFLLDRLPGKRFELITPRDSRQRGCQLSMLIHERPRALLQKLETAGIMADFREPNVIRVAPVPLYNTFHEVWTFAQILGRDGADQPL